MSVASTILEQLGGNRFRAMTGAKNFMAMPTGLVFMLPGKNFAKSGINKVQVTLTPADEYDLEFFRVRAGVGKPISEARGIYCDQLQEVFKEHTGLDTHL